MGLQEDGAEGRRQRQGVQGGDEDGHGHRHAELAVERTRGATEEAHGDEHRGHHQGNRDDGARNLVHGVDGGRERRLVALVELGVHGLDDHDGIVHHDGDGQQQGAQRQQVDGEAEDLEEEERTDERHRHGDERDERGAEVLQEDVHHEEHQHQRHEQGEDDLLDGGVEELRHVVVNLVEHARRHQLGLLLQLGLHLLGNLVGVRAGNLLHHTHHRRDVVVLHRHRVLQAAQLNAGHVLQLQRVATGIAADDDVAELLGRLQTTGVAHGILEGHVALLTKLTRCSLDVLLGQHAADVRGHQVVLLHHVGLQPDAHRVGLHTGALHVAHALDTLDGRNNIDIVIVRQELVVVAPVAGQGEHHHLRGLALHHRHADARHLGRQQRLCLLHAVLHVHGAHVGVHALAEEDADAGRAAGGRRAHVVHAFHTVDALLQGCQHGVLHRLGVGTRIAGEDHDGGRRNIGILLNGQRGQADETQNDDEDGNHRRQHWPFDKCCKCHTLSPPPILPLGGGVYRHGGCRGNILIDILLANVTIPSPRGGPGRGPTSSLHPRCRRRSWPWPAPGFSPGSAAA